MKNRDEIEDLFASSFGNFEETPPTEVKANLDAQLFPSEIIASKKSTNWKWLLLLFPFTAILAFVYLKSNPSNEKQSNLTAKNSIKTTESNIKSTDNQQTNVVNPLKLSSENSNSKSEGTATHKNQKNIALTAITNTSSSSESTNNSSNPTKISKTKNVERIKANKESSTFSAKNKSEFSNQKSNLKSIGNSNQITDKERMQPESKQENHKLDASYLSIINEQNNQSENVLKSEQTKENSDSEITKSEEKATNQLQSEKVVSNQTEQTKNSEAKFDSTAKTTNEIAKNSTSELKDEKQKFNATWGISLYGGIANGINVLTPPYGLFYENLGPSLSLETNYQFNKKMSVSTGISYDKRIDLYSKDLFQVDSVVSNYTMQFVTDSMNVVIDTIFTYYYSMDTTYFLRTQNVTSTSFSLPLFFNYELFSKNNWSGAVSAGVRINFFKTIVTTPTTGFSEPALSSFGVQSFLRPQLKYDFGKFGVGIYGSFGLDIKQPVKWTDFSRQRWNYGTGFFMTYKF